MLNNLGAKAIVPVALTVTGFALVCCILLYAGIKADMTRDAVAHSLTLADTVVKSTRFAMLRADRETLGNIVDNVGRQQEVDHLRIFDKKGLISFSSNPTETGRFVDKGAGGCLVCHSTPTPLATLEQMQQARRISGARSGDILAVTAPIYNEPACSNASCHVHPEGQKILGILDIGLDLAPLEASLAALRWRMAIFTLMLLILTGVGVAALLRRTVLVPIQSLVDFTSREIDNADGEKPLGLHDELEIIADNHLHVRRRLGTALSEIAVQKANPGAEKS